MSNLSIVLETTTDVKQFSIEEAKNAYLSKNSNASFNYNFWSFQDVKNENIPVKMAKAEAKLEKSETEEDYQDAIKELRRYKRVGLVINRIVTSPFEYEGKRDMRIVVVFHDPFTDSEIAMKQTIVVNTIINLNIIAGQMIDGEKFDTNHFYLRGEIVDIIYEGRKKNIGNEKESDVFDIKPSQRK